MEAIERALAESQAERDELLHKIVALRAELDVMNGWYPLDIEGKRVFVCLQGEEDAHWLAVFRDKKDADDWAAAKGRSADPDNDIDVFVHEGEAAGIRFWNDGVDPIPAIK